MNDADFLFQLLIIVGTAAGVGFMFGWFAGRSSMVNEIYGRRRNTVLRRALRRLDNAVKASKSESDEWAEVID